MVALSRLKATFEACPGLFSPKHRLASREGVARRNRAAAWGALTHFQRCQRYSMKIVLLKMHERRSPQSACPMHAGNLVLKRGENKFFREVTVAWAKAYGQTRGYMWASDAIHRFLHNFNVDSCGYSASIRSCSPFNVPCHCSFTQPITCIRSLATRAVGIPLS